MESAILPIYDFGEDPGGVTLEVAHGLMEALAGSGRAASSAQIAAAHQLAGALEAEEAHFLVLAGDPVFHPMQRTHFPIGKLLAAVKSHQELYDVVAEQWSQDGPRGAPLPQRVAGLRLLLACLSAWGADSYPLSDDDFLTRVMRWAMAEETAVRAPAVRGDDPPADADSYLAEAHATYATGLLAIALTVDEFADEAVRSGTICSLARYLRRSVLSTTGGAESVPQLTDATQNRPLTGQAAGGKPPLGAVVRGSPRISGIEAAARADVLAEEPSGGVSGDSEAADGDEGIDLGRQAGMLRGLREWYALQGTACLGEYLECLAPVMQEHIVEVAVELLHRWRGDNVRLVELLRAVCSLMAHRRFAEAMVAAGGLQLLLDLPQNSHTAGGISLALFGLASLPTVFERVCSAPAASVEALARTALELSSCPSARKNTVLFLGASLHYRPILDAFDAQDGLRRLLNLIRAACLALRVPGAVDLRTEKQVAYHASHALQHYMRTHLLVHVATLQRRLGADTAQVWHTSLSQKAASQARSMAPLSVGQEALDAAVRALEEDRRLAVAFVRSRWAPLEAFMDDDGAHLMLDLIQTSPGERYYNEMALYALDVLHIASMMPYTRRAIVSATVNNRSGMAILLSAAGGHAFLSEPEVMACAQLVLVNLVTPPPALAPLLPMPAPARSAAAVGPAGSHGWKEARYSLAVAQVSCSTATASATASGTLTLGAHIEQGYAVARAALRSANGIKVLLGLLGARPGLAAAHVDRLRALAARVLLGLARDPSIRHILAKLQVGQVLAEHIQEPVGASILRRSASHASAQGCAAPSWHVRFNRLALELIAATTSTGLGRVGVMVTDAAAPALQRIERAAIAASTQIMYPPHELLRLIQEHLRASGLHSSAAALGKEAGLGACSQTAVQALDAVRVNGAAPGPSSTRKLTIAPALQRAATSSPGVGPEPSTPGISRGLKRRASTGLAMRPPPAMRESVVTPEPALLLRAPQALPVASPSPEMAQLSDVNWLSSLTASKGPQPGKDVQGDCTQKSSVEAPLISQLLSGLPQRSAAAVIARRPARGGSIAAAVQSPLREPAHRLAARRSLRSAGAQPTSSKLNSIVMQHLRHQHRAACMQSTTPISTLPPLSLLKANVLPQARRSMEAPLNAASRIMRRQTAGPYGGFGGRRQQRHMIYSRFRRAQNHRHLRTIRDEDHMGLLKSACFLPAAGLLALGSHMGELRLYDSATGEPAAGADDHSGAVNLLRSWQESDAAGSKSLLLSSSRQEVKLWDVSTLESGALVTWEDCRGGHFDHAGTRAAAVGYPMREVRLFDISSGKLMQTLADLGGAGSERSQRCYRDAATFSPADDLLLWGNMLWDPRALRAVHRFDQFTDFSGGCFHPAGLEVVMNSEVWDLRTLSLLRSVPALDCATPTFAGPDVLFAIQRPVSDDLRVMLAPRRSRHPLHTAFRTMDATDYTEISTVDAEGRALLDLALDPAAGLLALVTVDAAEGQASSARIYEIGRSRSRGDDSDGDGGEDDDESDDDDDDVDSETEMDEEEEEEALEAGQLGEAAFDDALEAALLSTDGAASGSSDDDDDDDSSAEEDEIELDIFDGVSEEDDYDEREDAEEEEDLAEGSADDDSGEDDEEALARSRSLLRLLINNRGR